MTVQGRTQVYGCEGKFQGVICGINGSTVISLRTKAYVQAWEICNN